MSEEYATVDDVIEILKKESEAGRGDYLVYCNDGEYLLAKKCDKPTIWEEHKEISIGGYC